MSPCSSRGKSTGLSFSAPALRRSSGTPETTRRCPIRRRPARGWRSKGISDGNARKRKAAGAKGKGKDSSMSTSAKDLLAKDDSSSKRCKSMEEGNGAEENSGKGKAAQSSSENGGKKHGKVCASKPLPDPHQDFIHVRARHGEATDSHSLAERLRREKISQRMKLLQDLVPGCNKVVGKVVMLEE